MRRLALILTLIAAPVFAVEPGEMLDDPALEARAQALDNGFRCVQCQSESIASSNAGWARDARVQVRALIEGGATDAEVRAYFVERFGEYVLMEPDARGANLILWLGAPALLLAGIGIASTVYRKKPDAEETLNEAEKARIAEILKE